MGIFRRIWALGRRSKLDREIDDELGSGLGLARRAQQHRSFLPVRVGAHGLVRNEAAVGECPKQVIEALQVFIAVKADEHALVGEECLLDLLAGKLPAVAGIASRQHVEIGALH